MPYGLPSVLGKPVGPGPGTLEGDGGVGGGLVNRTQGGRETVGGGGRPVFGLHMLKVNVSMEYEEGRSRGAGA